MHKVLRDIARLHSWFTSKYFSIIKGFDLLKTVLVRNLIEKKKKKKNGHCISGTIRRKYIVH